MPWEELSLESEALRDNPLGDPAKRPIWVWAPADADAGPLPALFVLHGMTGQGRAWFNVSPFAKNVPALVDELGLDAIVVLVDGWTAIGGSQWIDSPAIGNYGTYLCEDVVGFVDANFASRAGRSPGALRAGSARRRGRCCGPTSSPAFASHAGDALFEVMYPAEFAAAAQALRNLYDGSVDRFWDDLRSGRPVFENRTDPLLQNVCAAAAAYSPGELPFRIDTGELVPEVWERWLAWDPVRLAAQHGDALRAAKAIWIDAGRDDEYRLDLGATAFANAVSAAGVSSTVLRFELHEGTHRGTNWRLPLSLAYLADRLACLAEALRERGGAPRAPDPVGLEAGRALELLDRGGRDSPVVAGDRVVEESEPREARLQAPHVRGQSSPREPRPGPTTGERGPLRRHPPVRTTPSRRSRSRHPHPHPSRRRFRSR